MKWTIDSVQTLASKEWPDTYSLWRGLTAKAGVDFMKMSPPVVSVVTQFWNTTFPNHLFVDVDGGLDLLDRIRPLDIAKDFLVLLLNLDYLPNLGQYLESLAPKDLQEIPKKISKSPAADCGRDIDTESIPRSETK
jgi:hypothetical protein